MPDLPCAKFTGPPEWIHPGGCQNKSPGQGQNPMSENKSTLSQPFRQTILDAVTQKAEQDPLFAENLKKEHKNIDHCCNYILNTVKNSGVQGFTDDEIFSMAFHYYQEDDIDSPDAPQCEVVINHTIQLTDDEIAEAKRKAKEIVIANEKSRLTRKTLPVTVKKSDSENHLTLF